MKPFLLSITFISLVILSKAQVQFWNITDIENEAWAKTLKEKKVKQVALFRTSQNGKKLDSAQADEIRRYNANGQLVETSRYKYSWTTRKWELLALDSFIYNTNGKLISYRSFEGPEKTIVYRSSITYNARQQQTRLDEYRFNYGTPEADGYQVYTYDAKQQPVKLVWYDNKKKLKYTRTFSYDAKGRLAKTTFEGMSNTFSWNDKGQLLNTKEFMGKEPKKTITYTYNAQGQRMGKNTITTYDYDDATIYTYQPGSPLLNNFYLQYPGSGGKTDRRHEYTLMEYQYY